MASAGDVIMPAVAIYLDMFNLFLNLLSILQEVSGNSRDWRATRHILMDHK